jgi:hypothetical protein
VALNTITLIPSLLAIKAMPKILLGKKKFEIKLTTVVRISTDNS